MPGTTLLDIPPHCLIVLGHWLQLSVTSLGGQQGHQACSHSPSKCPWRHLTAGQCSHGLSCPDVMGRVLLLPTARVSSHTFLPPLCIAGHSSPPLQLSRPQPLPFPPSVAPSYSSAWLSLQRHPKLLVLTRQRRNIAGLCWQQGDWTPLTEQR